MTLLSYAQNYEDVLLWRALGDVAGGFYIDAGAWHPDIDSVTRVFHDHGWRGINIEPVAEHHQRLAAARPRDLCLNVALGATEGTATLYTVAGTGLSTLSAPDAARAAEAGFEVAATRIARRTLAGLCAEHAPRDIHFLKIDVEGGERDVLAGADFTVWRPWIVLVEAVAPLSRAPSHAEWEPLLTDADYRFVWFDGLNRFYVAAEHHDRLAPLLALPPNVFDGFLRVADSDWARRIGAAEQRAEDNWARAERAELRGIGAEHRATDAMLRHLAARQDERAARAAMLEAQAAHDAAERHIAGALRHAAAATARADAAEAWLAAVRSSTSWRLTGPLRRILRLAGRGMRTPEAAEGPAAPVLPDEPPPAPGPSPGPDPAHAMPAPASVPPALTVASHGQGLRAVHQFHAGSATGDAITNAMLLTRRLLRDAGYVSDIYVEHRDPALAHELRMIDELPAHAGYVLIVRHSMGHDGYPRVASLPAPKVLIYHNITPPALLAANPGLRRYAELGRAQLAGWRGGVTAALADSDYNAIELHRLGFPRVATCTLLFDIDTLRARAAAAPAARGGAPFTVLFVGRVMPGKAQDALVAAFAAACRAPDMPDDSRLVLVGRHDGPDDAYVQRILAAVRDAGLGGRVVLTGAVSDDELDAWYARADLYVSLSRHEGYGVPLIEAAVHGVPVLAHAAGAVPYTLDGDAEALLDTPDPEAAGARIAALAADADARAAIARRQGAALHRYALARQWPVLQQALLAAGAAPPRGLPDSLPDPLPARLAAQMRVTVAGHLAGSYSLAAVNRRLAGALEAAIPGRVRVAQIEAGHPVRDLSGVPAAERAMIAALADRPPPVTGPHIVISQHYPAHLPDEAGDALLALLFWEESLLPAATVARLNAGFRGVLAPSAYVAKVLVDSGVAVPVRVIGHAPDLAAFAALPARADQARANRAQDGRAGQVHTFLHVSSCFPRKGLDVLLRAYAAAFRRGDPVRLIVKTFPNPHNDAAARIAALEATDPEAPVIELIDRDIGDAALAGLYAAADTLVLPTRGEGYNLPAAEAMAAGLPVIVTGRGGHADFCTDVTARLVACRHAPSASHLATDHSVWFEPDAGDLAAALREAVTDPAAARTRAAAARARIATAADPVAWTGRIRATAIDLLLRPPPAPPRLAVVTTWAVRCGIAEYARALIEALPDDPAIGAITILADDRTAPDATHPRATHPRATVRAAWRLHDGDSLPRLAAALAAADADAVLIQHQPGLLDWESLAALLDLPVLHGRAVAVTLHNTRDLPTRPPAMRAAAVAALGRAGRVLVHTVADLDTLAALGLAANTALLPQGIAPPDGTHPGPPRDLPPDAAPVIGCTGFFLPGKGIPDLIGAAGRLRADWPGLRLRLVNAAYGGPESEREIDAARAAARAAGMMDAIDWHTDFLPAAEGLALLRGCDLVVLPTRDSLEASSASLRTALAAGAPVLVTDLPLFDEAGGAVLRAAGTGPVALAEAIGDALRDRAARTQVAAAARGWAEAHAWPRLAARLAGLLRGLVASDADRRAWVAACEAAGGHQPGGQQPGA